jgi:SET domain-containing protein
MLLVKTYLDKSRIHGIGVFAGEFIRKDTKIWRFVIGFDQYYSLNKLRRLPKQARDYLNCYGFRWENEVLFSVDNDAHTNHSDTPNTYLKNGYAIARRNIRKGEEITYDYGEFGKGFCTAFLTARKPLKAARSRRRSSAR